MYKIKFSDQETNIFNSYELESRRQKLMSLYAYLLKISENGSIKISFSILHKRYTRSHFKMSLTTIKDAIKKLTELGLIKIIDKVRKTNVYGFTRFNFNYFYNSNATDISTHNPTSVKPTESIGNTDLEQVSETHKYKNNKLNYKDIDSNIPNDNFDYESYLNKNKKADLETVISTAHTMFNLMHVKSNNIKANVIAKLTKYADTITLKHLETYICRSIANAREASERNYKNNMFNNKNSYVKTLKFCDYDQREYDYDDLEKKLLGWVD